MTRAARALALTASACASLWLAAAAAGTSTPPDPTSSVIVTAASADALPGGASFVAQLAHGLRFYTLPVPRGTDATNYAATLRRRPGVYEAQPNIRLRRAALASPCADAPSANNAQIVANAVSATTIQATGPTPLVAVLDTGVDPTVPELAGRVKPGINATDDTTDTTDTDGHGTEVASVVAARAGRFQGVSPTTPILPVKIYNRSSETTVDWVVKGIDAAVKAGAPVINLSSSNPAADVTAQDSSVLQLAITAAFARGTITVVSAGNEGKSAAAIPGSLERVLTVGSATPEGTRDAFSNFGPWIDLVSPGANLILPAPAGVCTSGYGTANGTSFSAPAVAGGAALMLAMRPGLGAQQLFDLLRLASARDVGAGARTDDLGYGMLSVSEGVNATLPTKQATEVDDDVFWLKQDPKAHPTLLTGSRLYRQTSSVQPGKDPNDVYPVALKKGELLTISAAAAKSTGLLDIGMWSPNTGSYDIGKGTATNLLKDADGLTNAPSIGYRAKRSGTFYVSVEAPDLPVPAAADADQTLKPVAVEPYTRYKLTLRKSPAKKKAKKKKKKK